MGKGAVVGGVIVTVLVIAVAVSLISYGFSGPSEADKMAVQNSKDNVNAAGLELLNVCTDPNIYTSQCHQSISQITTECQTELNRDMAVCSDSRLANFAQIAAKIEADRTANPQPVAAPVEEYGCFRQMTSAVSTGETTANMFQVWYELDEDQCGLTGRYDAGHLNLAMLDVYAKLDGEPIHTEYNFKNGTKIIVNEGQYVKVGN